MAEKTVTPARIALGAASLIALAAITGAVLRGRQPPPPPPASAGAAQTPDLDTLIPQLEAKLRDNSTDANGWRLLGWAYFQTERYAKSADAYARAAAIDPGKAEYWSALGEAVVMAEKGGIPARAADAFLKALAADQKDARARYFLAAKKDLDGDHKGAVEDWLALLRDGPADAPWVANVRQAVQKVAADNHIDLAGRLPEAPAPASTEVQAIASLPPAQQQAVIRQMVDRLAARLKANPKDATGWIMLMRARAMLNDPAGAQAALADGRAAFAGDAATLARLAEAARALGIPGA